VDRDLFGQVVSGSERFLHLIRKIFAPDPDLHLIPDLTFLNIIIANCSLKWSIRLWLFTHFLRKSLKCDINYKVVATVSLFTLIFANYLVGLVKRVEFGNGKTWKVGAGSWLIPSGYTTLHIGRTDLFLNFVKAQYCLPLTTKGFFWLCLIREWKKLSLHVHVNFIIYQIASTRNYCTVLCYKIVKWECWFVVFYVWKAFWFQPLFSSTAPWRIDLKIESRYTPILYVAPRSIFKHNTVVPDIPVCVKSPTLFWGCDFFVFWVMTTANLCPSNIRGPW
jgi:hypothetical protein